MATILKIVRDGTSIPTYARRVTDESYGIYAQAGILNNTTVPSGAQLAIISGGVPYMVSPSSYTAPINPGDSIPAGVALNIGAIWVEDLTTLYFSTVSNGLVNIEFYKIQGDAKY